MNPPNPPLQLISFVTAAQRLRIFEAMAPKREISKDQIKKLLFLTI